MANSSQNMLENADVSSAPALMENATAMNRTLYFEAVLAKGKNWRNRIFGALGIVIAAMGLLMSRNGWVMFCGVLIALLAWFSPLIIGWRDFGKLKRLHPAGVWHKTVRFFPDRIETDSGRPTPTVAYYKDIKREFETEHLYVLDFGKKAPATAFRKDSFTRGSLDQLRPFLLEQQRKEYAPTEGSEHNQFAEPSANR